MIPGLTSGYSCECLSSEQPCNCYCDCTEECGVAIGTIGNSCNEAGRGLHSSTSQLNLSRFFSLTPQLSFTSQLNLRRFCR